MNKSDGERIAGLLEKADYQECFSAEDADLIIIVACSVRQTAVDRIYGRALKYAELKKRKPNLKIVLTGCVLDNDKKKLAEKFDAVCDIRKIKENIPLPSCPQNAVPNGCLPAQASAGSRGQEAEESVFYKKDGQTNDDESSHTYLSITPKYTSSFQAYIPIMTGCDNFCSYCVVPYTRGHEYSRPAEDILNEARQLIENGCKEIFLIGQNVNSYYSISPLFQRGARSASAAKRDEGDFSKSHTCLNNKIYFPSPTHKKIPFNPSLQNAEIINFPALLRLINSIKGDFWIRFATSHPKDMSDELISAIAECKKITPYAHLPIQSGSDKILKAMNRKYTKEHYIDLIKKIKSSIPNIMLSTDVIVGFPGETEKDFQETADAFKKIKYSMAYIARYSPRAGTAAFKMPDDVPPEEKARRENALTEILKQTALENNKKFVNKNVRVLVEQQTKNGCIGKTEQFVNVRLRAKRHETEHKTARKKNFLIGNFANVKILKAASFGMEGEALSHHFNRH